MRISDWSSDVCSSDLYPLQLYNVPMPRRAHGFFDNAVVMRELFPHEFIMNPLDAESRGIKNGDTVLVRSRWGKVMRTVWVTPHEIGRAHVGTPVTNAHIVCRLHQETTKTIVHS